VRDTRYNESDRNRGRQHGRDSDREYTITQYPSKPFHHVTELNKSPFNKKIVNSSMQHGNTRALCEAETDQTDRQRQRQRRAEGPGERKM